LDDGSASNHLNDKMSFLETNHVNGRRRISQPTREEWLASLQQQIQEKDRQKQYKSPVNSWAEPSQLPKLQNQDADHHLKNAVASPAQFSHSRTLIHEQAQRHVQEDTMYNEGALPLLPGRMRVTRLSKEEWINSLQKQIQEKQQHKQKYRLRFPEEENDLYANQRQEQAKSAVLGQSTTHVNTTFDAINGEPPGLHQQQTQNLSIKPQESVSILPQSAPSPLPSVTGGRRRASSSMSREQYLKSLEEQIQEKKVCSIQ
jgi:hypothetical protein